MCRTAREENTRDFKWQNQGPSGHRWKHSIFYLTFINRHESEISDTHPRGRVASSRHRQEMKTTLCRADDHCHPSSPRVWSSGSTPWLNRGKCAGWHGGSNYRRLTFYVTMEISSHLLSHMYTDRFRVVRFLPFNKSLVFLDRVVSSVAACQRWFTEEPAAPRSNFNLLMNCYRVSASTCGG